MIITRCAYKNTRSESGRPVEYILNTDNIFRVNSWTNSNGNPTFMIYHGSDTYLCVDDYGAMNNIPARRTTVHRRKYL